MELEPAIGFAMLAVMGPDAINVLAVNEIVALTAASGLSAWQESEPTVKVELLSVTEIEDSVCDAILDTMGAETVEAVREIVAEDNPIDVRVLA